MNPHPKSRKGIPNKRRNQGAAVVQEASLRAWKDYVENGEFFSNLKEIKEVREKLKIMLDYARFIAPVLKATELDMTLGTEPDTLPEILEQVRQLTSQ